MATKVRSLLNRAAAILNDEEFVRWEEAELLEWLNDGQRVIARGPATDAYVVRGNVTTVTGTVQNLPSDGIRLIDVVKDVSTGQSINHADYAMANMLASRWREASSGVAENYFYDDRNPKQFEVYPPQDAGTILEVLYNANPGDALINGVIIIDDMYADVLIDYIVYRALSKDTEDSSTELNRATAFYNAFLVGAGYKDATDALVEPPRS